MKKPYQIESQRAVKRLEGMAAQQKGLEVLVRLTWRRGNPPRFRKEES